MDLDQGIANSLCVLHNLFLMHWVLMPPMRLSQTILETSGSVCETEFAGEAHANLEYGQNGGHSCTQAWKGGNGGGTTGCLGRHLRREGKDTHYSVMHISIKINSASFHDLSQKKSDIT